MDAVEENKKMRLKNRNMIFIAIGIFVFFDALSRLWCEGSFGNRPSILFLFLIGPEIGFTKLFASLFLVFGEFLEVYKKKYAFVISAVSFFCAVVALILTCQKTFIWSTTIDTIIFILLLMLFFTPVFVGKEKLRRS